MTRLALVGLAFLAACGADEEPAPVASGVEVNVETRIGVTGSF